MTPTLSLAALLAAAPAPDLRPVVVPFGNLSAAAPAGWKSENPSNNFRSHQFKLPSADPAYTDAELVVYPGSSPKVDAKFAEWKGQFTPPDGKTADDVTKVSKFEAGGVTVHLLDVSGTWRFKEQPKNPKSKEEIRPEYRAVWAVVLHGDEATHVRLSGPIPVVGKRYPEFEAWLKGMK